MGVGTALGVAGIASGVGGAAIASHGADKAASTQASAADQAAQLQHQDAKDALDFQKQQYNTQQEQIAPWLKAGTTAINQLAGTNVPNFQAPTNVTEQNDPGYQFRLQQGLDALQNSAAARGGLLSGNTARAINDYAQNDASNEYGNVYNRALTDYNTNTIGSYNRLASLAGVGQQAQASSAQQGNQAASNITNTLLTSGQQQSNDIQNAAAARASGYAAGGNIWGNATSGLSNNIENSILLSQLSGYGSTPFSSFSNPGSSGDQIINPGGSFLS